MVLLHKKAFTIRHKIVSEPKMVDKEVNKRWDWKIIHIGDPVETDRVPRPGRRRARSYPNWWIFLQMLRNLLRTQTFFYHFVLQLSLKILFRGMATRNIFLLANRLDVWK